MSKQVDPELKACPVIAYPLRVEPEPGYIGVACILDTNDVLIAAMMHPQHAQEIVTALNTRVPVASTAPGVDHGRGCSCCDHPSGFLPAIPQNGNWLHQGRDSVEVCTAAPRKCEHCKLEKTSPECWNCGLFDTTAAAASPAPKEEEARQVTRHLDSIEHFARALLQQPNPMATATEAHMIADAILSNVAVLRSRTTPPAPLVSDREDGSD